MSIELKSVKLLQVLTGLNLEPELKQQVMDAFYEHEERHDTDKKELVYKIVEKEKLISAYQIVIKDILSFEKEREADARP